MNRGDGGRAQWGCNPQMRLFNLRAVDHKECNARSRQRTLVVAPESRDAAFLDAPLIYAKSQGMARAPFQANVSSVLAIAKYMLSTYPFSLPSTFRRRSLINIVHAEVGALVFLVVFPRRRATLKWQGAMTKGRLSLTSTIHGSVPARSRGDFDRGRRRSRK